MGSQETGHFLSAIPILHITHVIIDSASLNKEALTYPTRSWEKEIYMKKMTRNTEGTGAETMELVSAYYRDEFMQISVRMKAFRFHEAALRKELFYDKRDALASAYRLDHGFDDLLKKKKKSALIRMQSTIRISAGRSSAGCIRSRPCLTRSLHPTRISQPTSGMCLNSSTTTRSWYIRPGKKKNPPSPRGTKCG